MFFFFTRTVIYLAFLEMVIQCLVEVDEHSDSAMDPSYIPIFRR